MFKPHVTVACLVQAESELLVEETINGQATWNQPASHLEADETLQQAAQRELYEETGIAAPMDYFITVHQWIAPDNTPFVRFLFLFCLDLAEKLPTQPQDSDIDCCWWLPPAQILTASNLRSPLVAARCAPVFCMVECATCFLSLYASVSCLTTARKK